MSEERNRLYRLLAVANRELGQTRPGWCDDDYRQILNQCGASLINGKYTATSMSHAQLQTALAELKQRGFIVKPKQPSGTWRAARIRKLNAMWCELADNGHIRNRSEQAMASFVLKRIGASKLQWTTSDQLNQAVEILKRYAQRCEDQRHQKEVDQ